MNKYISKIKGGVLLFGILCLLAISCKKKETDPYANCGCAGETTQIINNEKAKYLGYGYFTLIDSKTQIFVGLRACKTDTIWKKSESDSLVANYIISGEIKKGCFSGPRLMVQPVDFVVTKIEKIN